MRWITLAAIVAIGAFVVPATAQQQQPQGQAAAEVERGTVLNVTASGVALAPPDMATVTLGVATQGRTAAEAVSENARRMTALVRSLRGSGLAERDIQT
ncbi:MAG: SIMPL domain-containing protein, partial [Terricaulis sp.]